MTAPAVVVVMAKAPRPGLVKTRLAPPLSLEQAARLYARLLADVLDTTAAFARELSLAPVVAVHPSDACAEIARSAPPDFRVVPQRGRDLAARMAWAVREEAAGGAPAVLLRGSDSPVLDGRTVGEALDELDRADLVLCPDRDGGYNLVGLRRPVPGLFDHPMSTREVLEDTLANARRLGLRARVRPPSFDLDTIGDLRWLAAVPRERVTALCPRTLEYLDEHELWRHLGSEPPTPPTSGPR